MDFFSAHQGEFYALFTAVFWTITALAFESASIKVGSLAVNIIRLVIGLAFLSLYTFIARGRFLPLDAGAASWFWLSLSGLIGFVLGDLFLFKSYTIIGSRFAMLIMSLVPPLTALLGKLILGESINLISYLGMLLTLVGIALAVLNRKTASRTLSLKLSPKGLLYAFGGAFGQALGLVLSKLGMQEYDAFASTQIRIIAGIFGFSVLVSFSRRWKKIFNSLLNISAMKNITVGSFFGPFLGVSFSLLAVAYTATGIASTIMAIVPVLIIPPAILIYKQKVTRAEIMGAVICVAGVAIFFII